mgnify:CR=1 FL=1
MTIEIKHRLTGKILHTVAADTLEGANLRGANLRGTYLRGAKGTIHAGFDSRGYAFIGVQMRGSIMINAGCRWFSLDEAKAHWKGRHLDDPTLHADCLARVKFIRKMAEIQGWATGLKADTEAA